MSNNLAQSTPTVRGTLKLRVTASAVALSCLGAIALGGAPAANAGTSNSVKSNSAVKGKGSYVTRVSLRRQSRWHRTSSASAPVVASPTTLSQPTTPTAPTAPTTLVTPTSPSTPTSPTTPTPAPAPTPSPTPTAGSIFTGSKLKDFALLQEAPNAITEVSDPLGGGEKVLKMAVSDKDVAPITPTENPRAQALSPDLIKAGDEFWLSTKFMLPSDFPSSVPGWMALVSIYGAPFNGPSPWQIGIEGNSLSWMRNGSYRYDVPWQMPLVRGRWVTVLLHERFASDGWVEMWIDGTPVKFFSGGYNPNKVAATEHLGLKTMDSSNNGGANAAKIMNYRKVGMFSSTTVYFGALRLGTTRVSVGA